MQLVAYGAQDIYLTGNPQITFFKVVYRRHTNFSMESIEQTWNGTSDKTDGRCTATISRNGDLITKMYLELTSPTIPKGSNPGAKFIQSVELEIGGQRIDKQTGLWMECWAELTEPNSSGRITALSDKLDIQSTQTNDYVYKGTSFQIMSGMGGHINNKNAEATTFEGPLFIPLRFWFCRNPGLSLPLIALQYHEVKVILDHTITSTFHATASQKLYVDYIYLDTDERRRFAQVSHEYLIEQIQYHDITSSKPNLNFNHPVKELIWCAEDKLSNTSLSFQNASLLTGDGGFSLKLNGHDRFSKRHVYYFTRQQVYDYHTGCGGLGLEVKSHASQGYGYEGLSGAQNDSIAVYSFALKPEEHQPSGTCNFSRIDSAQLHGVDTNMPVTIFAVNYNVLRIMSGMGGLAYSN
jgi:hypothetical protein